MHASTQYLKQVSGLLKTGVTSLRTSSSSYETMQGIQKFQIASFICENEHHGLFFITKMIHQKGISLLLG